MHVLEQILDRLPLALLGKIHGRLNLRGGIGLQRGNLFVGQQVLFTQAPLRIGINWHRPAALGNSHFGPNSLAEVS